MKSKYFELELKTNGDLKNSDLAQSLTKVGKITNAIQYRMDSANSYYGSRTEKKEQYLPIADQISQRRYEINYEINRRKNFDKKYY